VATDNIGRTMAAQQQQQQQRQNKQMRRPVSVSSFAQIRTTEAAVVQEQPPFPFHLFPVAVQVTHFLSEAMADFRLT
jgi:hypothetical protein